MCNWVTLLLTSIVALGMMFLAALVLTAFILWLQDIGGRVWLWCKRLRRRRKKGGP